MIQVITFALGLILLNKLVGLHKISNVIEEEIINELKIIK